MTEAMTRGADKMKTFELNIMPMILNLVSSLAKTDQSLYIF